MTTRRRTVLVTESLDPIGVAMLQPHAEVVFLDQQLPQAEQRRQLLDADVILSQILPIDRDVIEASGRLLAVAKHGVGVDNIDLAAATESGIPVLFAPGANARSVAEHTLALLLAVERRLFELDAAVRAGDYSIRRDLHLTELHGRRVTVLGAGRTGQAVLDLLCRGLGMIGTAWDIVEPPDGSLPDGCRFTASLEDALAGADVVTVHLPLTDSTAGLIGARELGLLPDGAVVVNVGRGGVVTEHDLAAAIGSGHLAGAGVDVFVEEPPAADSPLLQLGARVVATPHAGGLSDAASRNIARAVATDIIAVLNGEDPVRVANPGYRHTVETQRLRSAD